MRRQANPFNATLGSTPRYLAGRADEIADFRQALFDGPGSHERVTLISGPRGVGKTVLLNAFEDVAREQSWWVVSESATPGFIQRVTDAVMRMTAEQFVTSRKRLTGVSIASVGGVQWDEGSDYQAKTTLRDALTELLTLQAEADERSGQEPVGLLITLDELHHYRRDEVIEFGTTIQHMVRENRQMAVAMAGIPQAVAPLLASDRATNPVTFLRRAHHLELGFIAPSEVRAALLEPMKGVGVEWDEDALERAVEGCGGYPFMIQLVGQECYRATRDRVVRVENVRHGLGVAQRKLWKLVHQPALADLSDRDRDFLQAMACDSGPSDMADVAQRMGVDAQYASTYRRRLIDAEMIESAGYGKVAFTLPYMRDYLLSVDD